MNKPIHQRPWFIVLAYCLLFYGFYKVFIHPSMTKLPELYCAVEITYRTVQDGKIIEDIICMENSIEYNRFNTQTGEN